MANISLSIKCLENAYYEKIRIILEIEGITQNE